MDAFPDAPAAEITSARLAYGEQRALDGVDLRVWRGERTMITGPNGAGKSTLLEALARLRALDAGRVEVSVDAVALVPQRATVSERLPVSVRDVVALGVWGRVGIWRRMRGENRARVYAAMARADVAQLSRRPFATLSGGQRQRVLLAQGLARGADLLLLDEPTTGLDAGSSDRIRVVLRSEAARGVAVVCTTHDPMLLADADRVLHLADGRIIADTAV